MDGFLDLNSNEKQVFKDLINSFRNKQSNHLRVIVSLWISFAFGLFSVKDILVLVPFMVLILLIFLHFFDRFRFYLIAESVTLFQLGETSNSIAENLLKDIKPRRHDWWADKNWFDNLRDNTNRIHFFSFVFWIWIFSPKSRKMTGFLSLLWGSLIITRLFKDDLTSIQPLFTIYNSVSNFIICYYREMGIHSEFFLVTLILTFKFSIIALIISYIWFQLNLRRSRSDLSLKKIEISYKKNEDSPEVANLEEYCEQVIFKKIKNKKTIEFQDFKKDFDEFIQPILTNVKKDIPNGQEKTLNAILNADTTVYSCWVTVKMLQYERMR